MPPAQAKMTIAEIERLLEAFFPEARKLLKIEALEDRSIVTRMPFRSQMTRAGGTISGPAMMLLADTTAYFLTLAHWGPQPAMFTANLDIHFLARPEPVDLLATATLLRLGSRLAVSTVAIRSDGRDDIVAHATVTYSVPKPA